MISRFDVLFVVVVVVGARLLQLFGAGTIRARINALLQTSDPFTIVVGTCLATLLVAIGNDLRVGFRDSVRGLMAKGPTRMAKATVFRAVRLLPSVRAKIESELAQATENLQNELLKETKGEKKTLILPEKGADRDQLLIQVFPNFSAPFSSLFNRSP